MTGVSPADLLRVLGSAIRPDGAAVARPAQPVEDFGRLLDRARAGGLETGSPVTIEPGVGVGLSEATLQELGRIVDRAHAEGATRIAVLTGDDVLDVDVLSRRVLGELDLSAGGVFTGIDGVVRLDEEDAEARVQLPMPDRHDTDRTLLALLGGGESAA